MALYTRQCPSCEVTLEYSTKSNLTSANKKNSLCGSCASKKANETYESRRSAIKNYNDRVSRGEIDNPFKGKTHSDDSKNIMKSKAESRIHIYKTQEFRDTMSSVTSGEKNPMYKKTIYDAWVKKYGEEEAIKRQNDWKTSISKATKGEKNPMFGKPVPQGSGNGWSGYYSGWYFRSLHELSYMVKIIERFNLSWIGAEASEYKIKYIDHSGSTRTYVADFIIENKYLVEIKPRSLVNSINVIKKRDAARLWCENNGMIYKITNCSKLTHLEIKQLVNSGKLVFLDKYKVKYEQDYANK